MPKHCSTILFPACDCWVGVLVYFISQKQPSSFSLLLGQSCVVGCQRCECTCHLELAAVLFQCPSLSLAKVLVSNSNTEQQRLTLFEASAHKCFMIVVFLLAFRELATTYYWLSTRTYENSDMLILILNWHKCVESLLQVLTAHILCNWILFDNLAPFSVKAGHAPPTPQAEGLWLCQSCQGTVHLFHSCILCSWWRSCHLRASR